MLAYQVSKNVIMPFSGGDQTVARNRSAVRFVYWAAAFYRKYINQGLLLKMHYVEWTVKGIEARVLKCCTAARNLQSLKKKS
jgi:hypothetical protein